MSQVIVMTGATSGLSVPCAQYLASEGHRLLLIARNKTLGEQTIASLSTSNGSVKHSLYIADMASLPDLHRVAAEIRAAEPSGIDVLLNAGGTFNKRQYTPEGLEKTIAVNHLAYFVLTEVLKDLIRPGGRVASTASFVHRNTKFDREDVGYENGRFCGIEAYKKSKLYNILWTRDLAKRWEAEGRQVIVNCVNPGMIYTNFGKGELGFFEPLLKQGMYWFAEKTEVGGHRVARLATGEVGGKTMGEYSSYDKLEVSADARNEEYQKILWEKTEKWAGMNLS